MVQKLKIALQELNTTRPWPAFLRVWLPLALLSTTVYVGASAAGGYLGFPLDDAWIHQTYARNLAWRGEFAFVPGRPSAGSTAPLWSGLIALGYLLRLEPRAWTYLLGALTLGLNAWLAYRLVLVLWPGRRMAALAAGLAVALEWHLAWASASGMETALFSALALAVFILPVERAAWLGIAVGVAVLARPDGLTLLPFSLARVWVFHPRDWRRLLAGSLGFAMVFLPYLAFNYWMGGSIWPNTFYAKQAEYAAMRELPLLARLVWMCEAAGQCQPGVGLQPLIGAQMLLVPGLAAGAWQAARTRRWEQLIPLAWVAAFLAAYALRLPVTYQHGRYEMPVIPLLVALGVGGMGGLLRLRAADLWPRVLSRAWAASFGIVMLAFWGGLGPGAYLRDVRIIETEMVATARWINAHVEPEAVVAAHDIGALGYFGGRDILDLAGLISPDVIPFIRDEVRLTAWLTESRAGYLMTFPGWYPKLVQPLAGREVYRTGAPFSPAAGGENMVVYRWP